MSAAVGKFTSITYFYFLAFKMSFIVKLILIFLHDIIALIMHIFTRCKLFYNIFHYQQVSEGLSIKSKSRTPGRAAKLT